MTKEAMRWMFFFEQGNVKSDVSAEEEDKRIGDFVQENPQGLLYLPGEEMEFWVNLSRVKAISRGKVDLEAERKALEEAQLKAVAQAAAQVAGQ